MARTAQPPRRTRAQATSGRRLIRFKTGFYDNERGLYRAGNTYWVPEGVKLPKNKNSFEVLDGPDDLYEDEEVTSKTDPADAGVAKHAKG